MSRDFEIELLKKFDTVIKLLTISSLKNETQLQKIKILSGAGLPPKDIADLLGTTSNTVSVALNKLKKKNTEIQKPYSPNPEGDKKEEDNTND